MTPYKNNLMNIKEDYVNSSKIEQLESITQGNFVFVDYVNITINLYLQNAYYQTPFILSVGYTDMSANNNNNSSSSDSSKVFTIVFIIIFVTIASISTIFIVIHVRKE